MNFIEYSEGKTVNERRIIPAIRSGIRQGLAQGISFSNFFSLRFSLLFHIGNFFFFFLKYIYKKKIGGETEKCQKV